MTKFASVKKIHTQCILTKRNLELHDLRILCFCFLKNMFRLAKVFTGSSFSLYIIKLRIDETVNF